MPSKQTALRCATEFTAEEFARELGPTLGAGPHVLLMLRVFFGSPQEGLATPSVVGPSEVTDIPHAATTETFSFNRVGNAPRVLERGQRLTRGPLATRLNVSFRPA